MKRDDLIFDVGMYRGEDTAHYLARGFHVVGVEANPYLVADLKQRFAMEIREGRLTIVGAAIAAQRGEVEFPANEDEPGWSSMDPHYIARNQEVGCRYRTVRVPAVRFADLLAEHGVPHYLKVDIEGSDMLCVRALHEVGERPDYLSLETTATSPGADLIALLDELAELWTLGYRGFKFINQAPIWEATGTFASGQFAEETPGKWQPIWPALATAVMIRAEYELGGFGGRRAETRAGRAFRQLRTDRFKRSAPWYDVHAKLGNAAAAGARREPDQLRAHVDGTEHASDRPGLRRRGVSSTPTRLLPPPVRRFREHLRAIRRVAGETQGQLVDTRAALDGQLWRLGSLVDDQAARLEQIETTLGRLGVPEQAGRSSPPRRRPAPPRRNGFD